MISIRICINKHRVEEPLLKSQVPPAKDGRLQANRGSD
jgi:hypothetical protein